MLRRCRTAAREWQQTFAQGLRIESTFSIVAQTLSAHRNWKAIFGLEAAMGTGVLDINSDGNMDKRVQWWNTVWTDAGDSTLDATTFSGRRLAQTYVADTVENFENGVSRATRTLPSADRAVCFSYGPDTLPETCTVTFDDIVVRRFVASDAAIRVTVGEP